MFDYEGIDPRRGQETVDLAGCTSSGEGSVGRCEANLGAIWVGLDNRLDVRNARKKFQYFKCEKLEE